MPRPLSGHFLATICWHFLSLVLFARTFTSSHAEHSVGNNSSSSSSSHHSAPSNSSVHFYEPSWSPVSCPSICTCSMTFNLHLGESLKTVNCSDRKLTQVPRGIPFDTETLDLSVNELSDLYEQLPQLDQLLYLDLSSNQLKQLGRGHVFMNLTRLRHLDLSVNQFKTLFAGVFRGLKRLETLIMQRGALRYIDEHAFDGLENLRYLDLEANHVTSVYLELFQSILNLHVLNLGNNAISHLTGGIFASLNGLRKLVLDANRITGINDNAFVGLDMLEEMRLRDNFLSRVPSVALQSLKRLRILDMGGNGLQVIATGDLVHTPAVEVFIDNCDELTLIDRGAFWDLPNLKAIHAQDNAQLQYIDGQAFLGVPSLALLNVSNSSLFTLQEELAVNLAAHREAHGKLAIDLAENPVLCDCNVRYMYQCLKEANCKVELVRPDQIKCAQPEGLAGRKVSDLVLDKMGTKPAPAGNGTNVSTTVPISCAPTLLTTGPRNGTVHKKIGERHVFQCRAIGYPTPRLHWTLPSGEIINDTTNSIHMQLKLPGSLRMLHLKPRDTGVYTCHAYNSIGTAAISQTLSVDNIDLHIWPLGVSATFVTVVWNGTARNSFPEYQLLYRVDNADHHGSHATGTGGHAHHESSPRYESVTVSHFLRSYTINHLEPSTRYKLCIAVRDDQSDQLMGGTSGAAFLQLSCTTVTTQPHEFSFKDMPSRTSVAASALAALAALVMGVVVGVAFVAARKYRMRTQYQTPDKSLLECGAVCGAGNGSVGHSIPMEDIYSPLMPN